MTHPCRRGSIGSRDVIDTDLMYSIRHIHQVGGVNESRIYRSRPRRMICPQGSCVVALYTARVYLHHITIRSGGVDLNCVGNLVAIHWLRKMDLEWDGLHRRQTIVVPWEEFGDDWYGNYELILGDKRLEAPGCKSQIGKAAREWLSGIVVC